MLELLLLIDNVLKIGGFRVKLTNFRINSKIIWRFWWRFRFILVVLQLLCAKNTWNARHCDKTNEWNGCG